MKRISLLNIIIIGFVFFSCEKDDPTIKTEPDPLTMTYKATPVSVLEDSDGAIDITVSGGVEPYTYNWSNGSTDEDLIDISAGTYQITVTDSENQIIQETIVVDKVEPNPLTLSYTVTPVSVSEDSDGAIDITVNGGITPYTYIWSNGATLEDLDNIKTGIYVVTITDSINQSVSESIEVIKEEDYITIGIYTDNGAVQGCYIAAENMFKWMGHRVRRIKANDVNNGNISDIDVIYFPGGSTGPYRQDINETGRDNIKKLVSDGGAYIGTCAGALYACESNIWEGYNQTDGFLGIFPGVGKGPIPEIFEYPEIGICQIDLEKPHPITDSENDAIWIMYYNGPYFVANNNANIEIIGRYNISNHPAIVANEYGNGRVFLTGPHPEWEEDSDRDGISYFDNYDDHESDWPLMKAAVLWCIKENN